MNASEGLVVLADGTPSAATATATAATFTTTEEGVVVGDDIKAWIAAAQGWALTVACVGGVGNLLTIFTIAHQLYLGSVWRRRSFQHRHHHHHYHHHQQQQHQEQDHQHHHHHHHQPRQNAYLYPNVSCSSRPVVVLEGDTLLLLHLSICDFLYCVINLPLTAYTYNYALEGPGSRPSQNFCQGAAFFRYVNALAEWTTLGLLTVQRCVDLGRLRGARFFRPRPTLIFILAIWVGSVLLQMPAIVNQFDYDTTSYKCDMTRKEDQIFFYTLESLLPCGLVLIGCVSIIFQICRNTKKLKDAGMPEELARQRFRSMLKSTALLLSLLFLFLACVIPICVYSVYVLVARVRPPVSVGIAIFMIYWIQYGVYFMVYFASNANYRTAYKEFFKTVAGKLRCLLSCGKGSEDQQQLSPSIPETHKKVPVLALTPPKTSGGGGGGGSSGGGTGNGTTYTPDHLPHLHTDTNNHHQLHRHGSCCYGTPHRQLQRLRSYPSKSPGKDGPRRLHSFPMPGLHCWHGTLLDFGSQSSQSSVFTLESNVSHEAETRVTH